MSAMILLRATKKSAAATGGRSWYRPAFDLLSQRSSDGVPRSFSKCTGSSQLHQQQQLQQRALFSTKAIDKSDALLARSKQTLPLSTMVQHCNNNDEGSNGNTMISRAPPGNPTTMAFMSRSSGSTSSSPIRHNSSGAALLRQSDEDEDNSDDVVVAGDSSNGIAGGGMANKSQYESWMANLNRGTDNTWLSKPRTVEWYTGLQPTICPGSDEHGVLRSLPLPNLSNVTRQGTKDYFDNSWTLFEMMFAGLKGEEPFYRYVNNILFCVFSNLMMLCNYCCAMNISESTLLFVCHDQSMNKIYTLVSVLQATCTWTTSSTNLLLWTHTLSIRKQATCGRRAFQTSQSIL